MSKLKSFNGLHQNHYLGAIILRMFNNDEKKMKEFHEDYKEHCHYFTPRRMPEKVDFKIAEDYQKGLMQSELAKKYKMTHSKIDTRINRVARYNLMNQ